MANWFVDTGLASGSNNGTSMDNAWQSIKTAFESTTKAAGDFIWIRRTSSYDGSAGKVNVRQAGTPNNPYRFIGWPRAQHDISSSDWTNGSNEVTVDDADMSREKHQARYIIAPDGKRYLITRVVDSDTIMIDREYPGTTVTNNSTAYIEADDYYTEAQAIDDSSWTIKKTDWNGDSDDLPHIDFGTTASYLDYTTYTLRWIEHICLRISGGVNVSGYGAVRNSYGKCAYVGCLFKQTNNACVGMISYCSFRRCTFEGGGSGAGSSNIGIYGSYHILVDCAVYNFDRAGILGSNFYIQNCNFGVELPNYSMDINSGAGAVTKGIDVKLGGYASEVQEGSGVLWTGLVSFENYGKVLGASKFWGNAGQYSINAVVPVVDGSGDPYKRTGGSDKVIAAYSRSHVSYNGVTMDGAREYLLDYSFAVDTTQRTYRVYVQRSSIAALAKLRLEALYVDSYDDDSEYHLATAYSDESVAERSGADDWSQYVEVTVQPAVSSVVKIRLDVSWYDDTSYLYIDPLVEIS